MGGIRLYGKGRAASARLFPYTGPCRCASEPFPIQTTGGAGGSRPGCPWGWDGRAGSRQASLQTSRADIRKGHDALSVDPQSCPLVIVGRPLFSPCTAFPANIPGATRCRPFARPIGGDSTGYPPRPRRYPVWIKTPGRTCPKGPQQSLLPGFERRLPRPG